MDVSPPITMRIIAFYYLVLLHFSRNTTWYVWYAVQSKLFVNYATYLHLSTSLCNKWDLVLNAERCVLQVMECKSIDGTIDYEFVACFETKMEVLHSIVPQKT